jgi:hypothetical protein
MWAAHAVRQSWIATKSIAEGLLVETILVVGALSVIGVAVGAVGVFRFDVITIACLLASACVRWRLPQTPSAGIVTSDARLAVELKSAAQHESGGSACTRSRERTTVRVFALVALALVSATWMANSLRSLRGGMNSVDSNWYHMPTATRFAQTGSTWALHVFDHSDLTVFYPSGAALVHAIGIEYLASDGLSPFVNLGWYALALLAAWCIGSRLGAPCAASLGMLVLLGMPHFVTLAAGQALNDIAVLACLAASLAMALAALDAKPTALRLGLTAMAGGAAGLAVGMKWTAIAPAVVLALVTTWLTRDRRVSSLAASTAAMTLTGGYWYFRDIVHARSPVPPLPFDIGPLPFDRTEPRIPTFSILGQLGHRNTWTETIAPGLRLGFGNLWFLVVAGIVAGLVAGVLTRVAHARMVAVVGITNVLVYVVADQGFDERLWNGTLRYAGLGCAIGLLLCGALTSTRALFHFIVTSVMVGVAVLTQLDRRLWRDWLDDRVALLVGAGAGVLLLVAVISPRLRMHASRRFRPRVNLLAGVVAMGLLLPLAAHDTRFFDHGLPEQRAAAFVRERPEPQRVGLIGNLFLSGVQYQFYGRNLANHVQYLGELSAPGPDRRDHCRDLVRAINHEQVDVVVVNTAGASDRDALDALAADRAASFVTGDRSSRVAVLALRGTLQTQSCPG